MWLTLSKLLLYVMLLKCSNRAVRFTVIVLLLNLYCMVGRKERQIITNLLYMLYDSIVYRQRVRDHEYIMGGNGNK